MRHRRDERGFALVAAVFALVIITGLVTGAFFAARQEMRTGRSSQSYQRAFAAAEAGLNSTITQWNTGTWNTLLVGDSATVSGTLPSGGGTYGGTVRRLNNELFIIRTLGQDPAGTSQRTLATLVRLAVINMNFTASLETRNSVKLGGSSLIDGRNTPPPGWACPTARDTVPGVLINTAAEISTSGCSAPGGNYACIIGNPDVKVDASINDSTFFKFGDLDWNELASIATLAYPAGDVGPLNGLGPIGTATTCTTSNTNNWGEPGVPPTGTVLVAGCRNYFPIIYVNGNLKITGGRGQGILLVEGDLSVQGGFEFYGPVIVRGVLSTQGTGGHFNGGVMAANVDLTEQSNVLGDAVLTYSSCTISKALQFNAPGRILSQRSWAELF